jgi:hypothetical protein
MLMRVEDHCGVSELVYERETEKGTKYSIAKWTCPNCGKANSTLYLDGTWCHGDSLSIRYIEGERSVMCGSCWMEDGHMQALKLAAAALACACIDAPQIQPHSAYHAVCDALKANERDKPPASDWTYARREPHNVELKGRHDQT